MKTSILFLSFLICSFQVFSQRVRVIEKYYAEGAIMSRGFEIPTEDVFTKDTGLWTYWYPNGQKLSEDIRDDFGKKYINSWTNTGQQICTNGNGRFMRTRGELGFSFYAIKDSIRHGPFEAYTYVEKRHVKAMEGNYINDMLEGEVRSFYETGQLWHIQVYYKGEAIGWRKEFLKSGKLEGEGRWVKECKDSVWTYYNYLGNMEKKVTHVRGSYDEHVVEFYANGEKKAEGDYVYGHHKIEKKGKEYIEVKTTLLIPVKNGLWMYYSNTGVPSKKEIYENGELIK